MKIALIVILAVLLVGGLIVFGTVKTTYNNLATEREAIGAQWSQVDVSLTRRADLIPNLVETVKGFAKHEETVFRRHRQRPLRAARRAFAAGKDRRQRPAGFDAGPTAGGGGELSPI